MDMNIATLPRKGLKTKPYSMDMNKDIATLPKKGLKKYDYNIDMDMNTATLPKKGLKKYDYNIDMDMNTATLPKKGLKTRPYNIGMEKRDLKKYDYTMYMDMEKEDLKKLSKGQLIRLLLKQEKKKPKVVIVDDTKPKRPNRSPPPIPEGVKPFRPTKTVKLRRKQKVVDDRPGWVRNPNTNRWIKMDGPTYRRLYPMQHTLNKIDKIHQEINETSKSIDGKYKKVSTQNIPPVPITNVPVPKIKELNKALKGHAKSYGIELQDNSNPLNHFTKTKALVESHLENLLKDMKGFKFIETLEVKFVKDSVDSKTGKRVSTYKTAFFNGKAKTITKADDIGQELSMSRQEVLNMIDKWVSEGSGWVIDRIDSHYINVTTYTPLHGSSYIELPTELKNPKKGLINIKNKDDECFRWCHIRQLNPQTGHPERIKKEDKKMVNKLNYDGIDFPLSQKHYNKVEKQNNIRINVFGYEKGQPFPIHISKETFEDQMNLLLITEDEKKHYVLIKDFNAFMYNQSKHKERKHFCMYCLQCFSSERILANHVNNCLTINGAQAINMPKQGENILKFNNFHKQLPVPFVIYADFEAITKKVQGCKQSEEMENEKNKGSTQKPTRLMKTVVMDTS